MVAKYRERYGDIGYAENVLYPGVARLLVVMNLFPQTASLSRSLTQVNERLDQLRFGNRLRQDSSTARQMNALIATIQDLSAFLSGPLPDDLQKRVDKANAYKLVKLIEISLTADAVTDDPNSFRDFSRDGIVARRDAAQPHDGLHNGRCGPGRSGFLLFTTVHNDSANTHFVAVQQPVLRRNARLFSGIEPSPAGQGFDSALFLVVEQQEQHDDHGDRNPKQPKQNSLAHQASPDSCVGGRTRGTNWRFQCM